MDKKFYFLSKRTLFQRLDVFPFIPLQAFLLIVYTNEDLNFLVRGVILFLSLLLQAIVFFSKFWSEKLRSLICYKQVNTIEQATHVRIDIIHENFKVNDRTEISEINKKVVDGEELIIIVSDKVNHIYDKNKKIFNKARFDVRKPVKDFFNIEPYSSNSILSTQIKIGKNTMNIPVPSFLELYKEHVVAPFFVFQLFCIMLWVFDDYGIHSMMTLSMLCIFEATVVGQRIMNLVALRKMRNPPHFVKVYRNNKWEKVSSAELLPGDIVSIQDGVNLEACIEETVEDNSIFSRLLKKLKEIKKKQDEQRGRRPINTVIASNVEKEPAPLTCDMVLLSGSAILNESMLTGESIPQIKESVGRMDERKNQIYDSLVSHKLCTLFAGTAVIKATRGDDEELPTNVKIPPPDNGCICMVTKTGFSTSQGKLLRTVMFTQDKNQGESKEAFIFIFILLGIALYAAYTVLIEGIQREGEITYKLLLRVVIIITSVVPAELPIELSLAINNSLMYLQGKKIMCIEPFRIPFAGKIDTCCFDKTGTLTKDEFIMRGVVSPSGNVIQSGQEVDENVGSILLGCNSLITISGKTVGDPIELVVFKSAGGSISNNMIHSKRGTKVYIEKRYVFDSSLRRMSCIATVYSSVYVGVKQKRVLSKGAPEVMKSMFVNLPDNYDETANLFAKKGFRILALGYRDLTEADNISVASMREEVEQKLIFSGFLITETPLKSDTSKRMNELLAADLNCLIITGDHYLTTAKIALDLNIGPMSILFGSVTYDKQTLKIDWRDLDKNLIKTSTSPEDLKVLCTEFMLGLTGDEITILEAIEDKALPTKNLIFKYTKLFCRVAPLQKDLIIRELIKAGCNPSMCGDGSNDVGALKRALIGVALLNSEDPPKNSNQQETPFSILSLDEDTNIKSGDVTAAAPFTSKSSSIKCVKNIIKRGRCTLVITFQMFKILALNCLLTAYCMSVLAIKGVKFSDYQSTYIGFLVAFLFLMLSRGEPLKDLNKNYPQFYFFTPASIVSVVGQAFTHLISLQLIIKLTEEADPIGIGEVKSLDDKFSPTLMNSVVFIYTAINNVTNFLVNYIGEPFMEPMSKNTWMKRLCFGVWLIASVCVFDLHPDLNEYFEILPLPDDYNYKFKFLGILLVDLGICYVLENWKKLLGLYKK